MQVLTSMPETVMSSTSLAALGMVPMQFVQVGNSGAAAVPAPSPADVLLDFELPKCVGEADPGTVVNGFDTLASVAAWLAKQRPGVRMHLYALLTAHPWENWRTDQQKRIGAQVERASFGGTIRVAEATGLLSPLAGLIVPGYADTRVGLQTYANRIDRVVEASQRMGKRVTIILTPWCDETCGDKAGEHIPGVYHESAVSIAQARGCDIAMFVHAGPAGIKAYAQAKAAGQNPPTNMRATGSELVITDLWRIATRVAAANKVKG